jgi:hypothetical protein
MNTKEQKTKKKTCSLALNGKRFKLYSCTRISPHSFIVLCSSYKIVSLVFYLVLITEFRTFGMNFEPK